MNHLDCHWRLRRRTLTRQALVGVDALAKEHFEEVYLMPVERQKKLRVIAGHNLLVFIGEEYDLPSSYEHHAAPTKEAPGLWLPTHLEPSLPIDLLARAVGQSPVLLWHEPQVIIPLDNPLQVNQKVLESIWAQWQKEGQHV